MFYLPISFEEMSKMAFWSRRKKAVEEKRGGDRFADRPTTQAAYDRLHFSRLVDFLADYISDNEKGRTASTIGVYGEWGSGKTSFLRLLDERLRVEKHIYPIWFDAWRYDKQDDLWVALLRLILTQAGQQKGEGWWRKRVVKFRVWWRNVSPGAGTWEVASKFLLGGLRLFLFAAILYVIFYITSGIGGKGVAAFLHALPILNTFPLGVQITIANAFLVFLAAAALDVGKLRDLLVGSIHIDFTKFERKNSFRDRMAPLDEFSDELRHLIALMRPRDKPLVVIIDDLDRCLPDNALRVLDSIKIFLDDSDCIFLLGLDRQVVETAIAPRYRERARFDQGTHGIEHGQETHRPREYHREYFDKIIPLAVAVPQLLERHEDIEKFVRELNRSENNDIIDAQVEACADIFGYTLSSNPRKIKSILRSFCFVYDLVEAHIKEQVKRGRSENEIPERAIRYPLLAKLILIQNQFAPFYETIIKQPSLLGKLETYYRNPGDQDGQAPSTADDMASVAESYAKEHQGLREILMRGAGDDGDTFVDQDIHLYIYQIGTLAEVGPSSRRQAQPAARPVSPAPAAPLAPVETPVPAGASLTTQPAPLAPAAGYTPAPVFWNVPARSALFIAREDMLRRLHDAFTQRLAPGITGIALCGLAGIGKTQIAVEYAYRYRQEYKAVFWARGETRDTLIADYVTIAELMNLPESNEPDQNRVIEAVKSWLERQTGWLLVLDGANDVSKVYDLLPPVSSGHLLLTTRQQNVEGAFLNMTIDSLAAQEGELLLLRRARIIGPNSLLTEASPADRDMAREIAQLLGGLPLALDQAGAFIEETRCTLEAYLKRYQSESTTLLQRRGGYGADHPESVAMTWLLSLQQIEEEAPGVAPAAEELLQLCALLGPDAIPIDLFRRGAALLGPVLGPVAAHEPQLQATIQELKKFSFVRRDAEGKYLTLHRLVQTVIIDEMEAKSAAREQSRSTGTKKPVLLAQAERAILIVEHAFPVMVDYATWPECQRYLPQALACAALVQQLEIHTLEAAHLLDRAGRYLRERAQYNRAEELLRSALKIREERLGQEHPDTVASLNILAQLYLAQGHHAEAEELLRRVLEISEQQLEPEHLDVATSLNNLASLYNAQNRPLDAEPLMRRALAIRLGRLGPNHPDVATNMSELALTCLAQGRYDEAILLLENALRIRQQVLGEDHPQVATIMNILARLYRTLGNYADAERHFQDALRIREQALGREHTDVAAILNDLAELYYTQARYADAEPLFQRALSIHKKALGENHPDLAITLMNLARLYGKQDKTQEAEACYKQALAIYDQSPEAERPQQIAILAGYASLLHQVQREQEAADMERRIRDLQGGSQQEGGD
jgi:tetratricopeptide (TPR) repeat protein